MQIKNSLFNFIIMKFSLKKNFFSNNYFLLNGQLLWGYLTKNKKKRAHTQKLFKFIIFHSVLHKFFFFQNPVELINERIFVITYLVLSMHKTMWLPILCYKYSWREAMCNIKIFLVIRSHVKHINRVLFK